MNKILSFCFALSLIAAFSSCKPKQSAYQSVYEAAKERDMEDNAYSAPATTAPSQPVYPVYNYEPTTNITEESVRTEKITPVYSSDANGLKTYSIVIASLSVKPNAEALKALMEQQGYNIILAQNDSGMYRVIIGSYDDKASAVNAKNQIENKFRSMGSTDYLRKTFGIPFNDLWILQRAY